MAEPEAYSFPRYLEAKRTVDERALNRRVRDRFRAECEAISPPLRVLEVGVGIGAAIERLAAWEGLPAAVEYTAIDVDPGLVQATRERLLERTDRPIFEWDPRNGRLVNERDDRRLEVELVVGDVFEFVADTDRLWDAVVGQAFLDLYDVGPALTGLCSAVEAAGLLYVPLTFDGGTVLEPPVDPAFDDEIERRYHAHMDGDHASGSDRGDSRAGRHLLTALPELGGTVLAAGGSDWVVVPRAHGYPADEAYFLHHIIDTVRGALADDPHLESTRFERWVSTRHRQVENGELVYIAHQLDVLAECPP